MNDDELDELLAESVTPLPASMVHEARALALETKPERLRRGRMPRPRWLIPVIVAGSVALTGAASITTAQLSVWPWVQLPDGFVRSIRVPVDFTTDGGHVETCGAYVELRNAGDGDPAALQDAIDALDSAFEAREWTGFGQELYDRGSPEADDDPDGESRVSDELYPELIEMTQTAVPGVLLLGEAGNGIAIGAMGLSCRVDTP